MTHLRRASTRCFCFAVLAVLLFSALLTAPSLRAQVLALDAAASAVVADAETSSVAWGDYTGDGLLDLVVTGRDVAYNPYGLVYRNDGAGGLVLDPAASAVVADVSNSAVAWGDYTGDGWLDLVVTGRDAASNLFGLVYRNDGAGGLVLDAAASSVVIDVVGGAVAWGDYTGDGMLDLIVTGQDNPGNRFGLVYRNDGSGGLVLDAAASAVVPDVTFPSVAWGDYTGDGWLDLVVTGYDGSLRVGDVFRNDGSGGLVLDAAASSVVADDFLAYVAWGDYTGDGALDLIVLASQGGGVYRNDGSGGLVLDAAASAVMPNPAGASAAWGDYTGDGWLDLVLIGLTNSGPVGQVFRNDGAGGFALDAAASDAVTDVSNGSVAWGDYTGDGALDLVVTGRDASRNLFGQVYRNEAPPVACEPGSYSATGNTPCDPAPAGTFVDTTGATEATACPDGQTTLGAGSTSIDDCFAELTCTFETLPSWDGNISFGIAEATIDLDVPNGFKSIELMPSSDNIALLDVVGLGDLSFTGSISVDPGLQDGYMKVEYTGGSAPTSVTAKFGPQTQAGSRFMFRVTDQAECELQVDPQIDLSTTPETVALHDNYPNPFNPTTTISFELPERADVRVAVYDVMGRQVKTLVSRTYDAGRHDVQWDGTDAAGTSVTSGIYFYRLEAGSLSRTKQMILLK